MKKVYHVFYIILIFFMDYSFLFSRNVDTNQEEDHFLREVSNPSLSVINVNNFSYWIYKDGSGTTSGSPNGTQGDYPIFSGGLIYEDGMLWGVKSNEYSSSEPIRVGGSTYYKGLKAGNVVYDSDGNVVGADDPANHHVWRVRVDWETADLTADAASFYAVDPEDVTSWQIQNIYDQYENDWINWPVIWGAPYKDIDENGIYDPLIDLPGYPGAYQTIWTIGNDIPTIVDEDGIPTGVEQNTAPNLYGSSPVGVELRTTIWAYNIDHHKPLGNAIFKKSELTYTGLENNSLDINPDVLDTIYFTNWSDPDLGQYTDDYVGCDIDLSLGYVYNGDFHDNVFSENFEIPIPSGGYDFLKSPVGQDGQELGMTAFTYFGAGSSISDPDLSSYNGSLQFFNLMEGFLPRPEYPNQVPWTNPLNGESTKFALSGDPNTGEGWIDGIQLPAGDRRIVMSSGPFSMSKGDKQEIVMALFGAQGTNHIESLRKLKIDDEIVQLAYSTEYNLLDYSLDVFPSENEGYFNIDIGLEVSSAVSSVSVTLNHESIEPIIFTLDSENNFSHIEEVMENEVPFTISLQIYLDGENSFIIEELNQKIIAWDPLVLNNHIVVYDNLSDDGELNVGDLAFVSLVVDNNSSYPIENLLAMVYDYSGPVDYIEANYLGFGNIPAMENASSADQFGESGYIKIKVSDDALEGDEISLKLRFFDTNDSFWEKEYQMNIGSNDLVSDLIDLEHVLGSADGSFGYRVVRPDDVTGHEYQLTFSIYDWGISRDLTGSSITGEGYRVSSDPHITLEFLVNIESLDYNYADGVRLTFPQDIVIHEATESSGSILTMINNNEIMFGDSTQSGSGGFAGGQLLHVFIDSSTQLPIDIQYTIYDDGWAQEWCIDNCETCESYGIGFNCNGDTLSIVLNSEGSITITEISDYEFSEGALVLNLKDLTSNEIILTTSDLPDLDGLNFDIIDGFKLFKGSVIYGAANDFHNILYGDSTSGWYDIDSYLANGWAVTAKAVDTWGSGITSPSILGRDIQIRFTGDFDYDNPITYGDGGVYYPAYPEGGSYAWIDGSRISALADHPDPANPGTGDPFRIKVPFEVWDIEADGGPQQIDITIYDRIQNYDGFPGDTTYVFNPYNRMYTHFIHLPYQENGNYGADGGTGWGSAIGDGIGEIEENLTWNLVWWDAQFDQGDTVTFQYLTPVSLEDRYVFTPSAELNTKNENINPRQFILGQNYPNPFNPSTLINYQLSKNSFVQLIIYDVLGREINRLVDHNLLAGSYKAIWNGKNASGKEVGAGMYFYKLKTKDFTKTKKMILLK